MELITEKYKQTQFGLIPEDWEVKEFAEVMDGFSSGQTPYRANKEYYRGNIPWITSGELNYNVILDTNEKITPEGAKSANLKMIPKGTFLFAITGLEAEGTRGSCAITGIDATTNQSCMALYPRKGKLTTAYLFHYYVRYGNSLALEYCQGTKQQSFTGGIAKKLPIILPPTVAEQTAIATALSDADNYISSLEKLIAKKRMIKQGAMQQLLKPKEGWVVKKLGDECDVITKGTTPTSLGREFQASGINFIKIESLTANGEIVQDKVAFIDSYTNSILKRSQLKSGDVLFSIAGALGKVAIVNDDILPANTNQALSIIRLKKDTEVDLKYLFFFLNDRKIQSHILEISVQGAQANLSLLNIYELPIEYPSKKEQTQIAAILSDMDSDLTTLEKQLAKAQSIKQGMMQQLLTGKIRLV